MKLKLREKKCWGAGTTYPVFQDFAHLGADSLTLGKPADRDGWSLWEMPSSGQAARQSKG